MEYKNYQAYPISHWYGRAVEVTKTQESDHLVVYAGAICLITEKRAGKFVAVSPPYMTGPPHFMLRFSFPVSPDHVEEVPLPKETLMANQGAPFHTVEVSPHPEGYFAEGKDRQDRVVAYGGVKTTLSAAFREIHDKPIMLAENQTTPSSYALRAKPDPNL